MRADHGGIGSGFASRIDHTIDPLPKPGLIRTVEVDGDDDDAARAWRLLFGGAVQRAPVQPVCDGGVADHGCVLIAAVGQVLAINAGEMLRVPSDHRWRGAGTLADRRYQVCWHILLWV